MKFLGAPYPITKHPNGFLHTQEGIDQVKSDLLILLLTNPGERVMLPEFGTPLRQLVFEPNDALVAEKARQMIAKSIRQWEPRIAVQDIIVTNSINENELNPSDPKEDVEHILGIVIRFFDPDAIQDVQELKLEVPIGGA